MPDSIYASVWIKFNSRSMHCECSFSTCQSVIVDLWINNHDKFEMFFNLLLFDLNLFTSDCSFFFQIKIKIKIVGWPVKFFIFVVKQMQCMEESAEVLRLRCSSFYKGCRKYTYKPSLFLISLYSFLLEQNISLSNVQKKKKIYISLSL